MIDAGLYNLDNFISHRCKIEEINSAINTMRAGESAHTIINFLKILFYQTLIFKFTK